MIILIMIVRTYLQLFTYLMQLFYIISILGKILLNFIITYFLPSIIEYCFPRIVLTAVSKFFALQFQLKTTKILLKEVVVDAKFVSASKQNNFWHITALFYFTHDLVQLGEGSGGIYYLGPLFWLYFFQLFDTSEC